MSEDVPYWSWFRVIIYSHYTKYPRILRMSHTGHGLGYYSIPIILSIPGYLGCLRMSHTGHGLG